MFILKCDTSSLEASVMSLGMILCREDDPRPRVRPSRGFNGAPAPGDGEPGAVVFDECYRTMEVGRGWSFWRGDNGIINRDGTQIISNAAVEQRDRICDQYLRLAGAIQEGKWQLPLEGKEQSLAVVFNASVKVPLDNDRQLFVRSSETYVSERLTKVLSAIQDGLLRLQQAQGQ